MANIAATVVVAAKATTVPIHNIKGGKDLYEDLVNPQEENSK